MKWFQRIFGKKAEHPQKTQSQSEELLKLRELDSFMRSLLKGDHYVARSEYQERLHASLELINWFQVLKSSGMLAEFCQKNGSSESEITQVTAMIIGGATVIAYIIGEGLADSKAVTIFAEPIEEIADKSEGEDENA